MKILYEFHDAATAAHPAALRTYMKLNKWYNWPKILEKVQKYVEICEHALDETQTYIERNDA